MWMFDTFVKMHTVIYELLYVLYLYILAVCNPPCDNRGRCIAPGKCSCVTGYTGSSCSQGQSTTCSNFDLNLHIFQFERNIPMYLIIAYISIREQICLDLYTLYFPACICGIHFTLKEWIRFDIDNFILAILCRYL
jgi:hypothetical protein